MDLWFYVNEIELFFASQQTGIFLYHCIDINDQTQKCANNVYWQLLIFCAYLYWYFAPMYIDILRQYININNIDCKIQNTKSNIADSRCKTILIAIIYNINILIDCSDIQYQYIADSTIQYININDLTQKCANNVLIFCANLASPRHSPSAGQLLAPMYIDILRQYW